MRHKATDFYIGLFVLAGLVAIAVMILKFSGTSTRGMYEVIVLFDDAGGLIKEAPVRYAGVECGKVKEIILWGKEVKGKPYVPRDKVKVVLLIDQDVTLHKEDEVKITAVGLLGEMAVQIVPAPGARTTVPEGGVTVGTNPLGLPEQVAKMVGPVREVMENLRGLTSDEGPVAETFRGLNGIVNQSLPALVKDIRAAVTTISSEAEALLTQNRKQIGDLVTSVNQTVKSSSGLIENLKHFTGKEGSLTGALEELRGAADDFSRVAGAAYPVVENLRTGKGTLGRLINERSWYDNLNKLVMAMREYGLHFEKGYEVEQREARRSPRQATIWAR